MRYFYNFEKNILLFENYKISERILLKIPKMNFMEFSEKEIKNVVVKAINKDVVERQPTIKTSFFDNRNYLVVELSYNDGIWFIKYVEKESKFLVRHAHITGEFVTNKKTFHLFHSIKYFSVEDYIHDYISFNYIVNSCFYYEAIKEISDYFFEQIEALKSPRQEIV